jgi:hypothetical protein
MAAGALPIPWCCDDVRNASNLSRLSSAAIQGRVKGERRYFGLL